MYKSAGDRKSNRPIDRTIFTKNAKETEISDLWFRPVHRYFSVDETGRGRIGKSDATQKRVISFEPTTLVRISAHLFTRIVSIVR